MNTGLSAKDLSIIKTTIGSFEAVESTTLFGSRAKGNYKTGSDIDIAIKLKQTTTNTLTPNPISFIYHKLEEETQLPYFFDVINYHTIKNQEFIEHIDRVGVKILQPPSVGAYLQAIPASACPHKNQRAPHYNLIYNIARNLSPLQRQIMQFNQTLTNLKHT